MRLQVESADIAHSIAFRLTNVERPGHVSALLTHEAGGWMLRMGDGAADAVTRHLAPARTAWPSALRHALAVCEEHLLRR